MRKCSDAGLPLSKAPLELAKEIDPRFTADILRAADAAASVARKQNAGGTGPASIDAQIKFLRERAHQALSLSAHTPRLSHIFDQLKEAEL